MPSHWFEGDPFASHFLDALSSTFPGGEAFFVRSVMHFRKHIEDPELLAEIGAFAAQEGQHRYQHDLHLELLYARYPGLRTRNRLMVRVLEWSNRKAPRMSLASTTAIEHLTALLAHKLLGDPERWTQGPMTPEMAGLWEWHALEESEHKAVAFDVLQQVAPSRALRSVALFWNSVGLLFEAFDRCLYMLWKDGLLFRRDTLREARAFLFGSQKRLGLLRGLGREYAAFYRRGFHPDDLDDRELLRRTRARIDGAEAPA